MTLARDYRLVIVLALGAAGVAIVDPGSRFPAPEASPQRDTGALRLPDTLPPYKHASSLTRLEVERNQAVIDPLVEQVAAAVDALAGLASIPPRVMVKEYRREGNDVVIDLVGNDLPKIKFWGAGGTVRILADGRRIILARHD